MVPWSLRILNYKRLRNLSLPLSARLVLKSRRNRIAQPSSLDEAKRQRMATKLLGIDVGTGGTRAVLLDEAGRGLGAAPGGHGPLSSPSLVASGSRRDCGMPDEGERNGQGNCGNRAQRTDARPGAIGCGGRGGAAGAYLVRPADAGGVPGDYRAGRSQSADRAGGESGADWIYAAEGLVGARA